MSAGLLVPTGYTMPTGTGWGQNVNNADGVGVTLFPIVRSFGGYQYFWGMRKQGGTLLEAIIPMATAVFIGSTTGSPPASLPSPPSSSYIPSLASDDPVPLPPTIPGLPPVVVPPPPSGPSGPAAFVPAQPTNPSDTITTSSIGSYTTGGNTYPFQLIGVANSGVTYCYQNWMNSAGNVVEQIYYGKTA